MASIHVGDGGEAGEELSDRQQEPEGQFEQLRAAHALGDEPRSGAHAAVVGQVRLRGSTSRMSSSPSTRG